MKNKIGMLLALLMLSLLLLCGCNAILPQTPAGFPEQNTEEIEMGEDRSPNEIMIEPTISDKIVFYLAAGRSDGDARDYWLAYALSKHGNFILTDWKHRITNDYIEELAELPIKAIIADFSYGLVEYFDLASSLQQIREEHPELLIIAIRPCEFIDEVIELADLVIFDDYAAWGQRIPQFASSQGAQAVVNIDYELSESTEPDYPADYVNDGKAFYNANRELFTQSLQQTCETLGLSYASDYLTLGISWDYEEYMATVLEKTQYWQNINKDTFFIYPQGRASLNQQMAQAGASLLPMFTGETDEMYASSFMLEDEQKAFLNNLDKRFDYAWINEKITEGVARLEATGRVFRDPSSNILLPIEAAAKYALAFMAGDNSLKTANLEFYAQCLQETMDEFGCPDYQVYVNTYDDYAENCFFFSTDLIVY